MASKKNPDDQLTIPHAVCNGRGHHLLTLPTNPHAVQAV